MKKLEKEIFKYLEFHSVYLKKEDLTEYIINQILIKLNGYSSLLLADKKTKKVIFSKDGKLSKDINEEMKEDNCLKFSKRKKINKAIYKYFVSYINKSKNKIILNNYSVLEYTKEKEIILKIV